MFCRRYCFNLLYTCNNKNLELLIKQSSYLIKVFLKSHIHLNKSLHSIERTKMTYFLSIKRATENLISHKWQIEKLVNLAKFLSTCFPCYSKIKQESQRVDRAFLWQNRRATLFLQRKLFNGFNSSVWNLHTHLEKTTDYYPLRP